MSPADGERRRRILRWQVASALFVCAAGPALHFAYDWSGQWRPMALVAAINESVWEHLKLSFWPTWIFAAIEWPMLRRDTPNFFLGKATNLALAPLVVVVVFYGYTTALGRNYLLLDVGLFFLAVIAAHAAGSAVLMAGAAPRVLRVAAIVVALLETLAFSLFTYFPPDSVLFTEWADHSPHPPPTASSS